jgi:hypothetical protein
VLDFTVENCVEKMLKDFEGFKGKNRVFLRVFFG